MDSFYPVKAHLVFRKREISLPLDRITVGFASSNYLRLKRSDGVAANNTMIHLTPLGVLVENLGTSGVTSIENVPMEPSKKRWITRPTLLTFGQEKAFLVIDESTCEAMQSNQIIAMGEFPRLFCRCCKQLRTKGKAFRRFTRSDIQQLERSIRRFKLS